MELWLLHATPSFHISCPGSSRVRDAERIAEDLIDAVDQLAETVAGDGEM
jgi:hypothetical protein